MAWHRFCTKCFFQDQRIVNREHNSSLLVSFTLNLQCAHVLPIRKSFEQPGRPQQRSSRRAGDKSAKIPTLLRIKGPACVLLKSLNPRGGRPTENFPLQRSGLEPNLSDYLYTDVRTQTSLPSTDVQHLSTTTFISSLTPSFLPLPLNRIQFCHRAIRSRCLHLFSFQNKQSQFFSGFFVSSLVLAKNEAVSLKGIVGSKEI